MKFNTMQEAIVHFNGQRAVPMNWNISYFTVGELKYKILVCAKAHTKGEKAYNIGDYYIFAL
jgi:hypothetical protein